MLSVENNNQYWSNRWDTRDIGFHQANPNQFLVKYLNRFKSEVSSTCIVPLCGASIDMVYLIESGLKVVGIELSETAAQSFFDTHNIPYVISKTKNNHKVYCSSSVNIIIADIFEVEKEDLGVTSALWYDRGGYIALPLMLRSKYAEKMHDLCCPKTKILLITSRHDGDQESPAFSITRSEINKHFSHQVSFRLMESYRREDIPQVQIDKGRTYQIYNIYTANI